MIDGFLIATPGTSSTTVHPADAEGLGAEFRSAVWPSTLNATDLVTRLQEQDGLNCVAMRQGFSSLSAPTKSLEKAILQDAPARRPSGAALEYLQRLGGADAQGT